MNRLLRGFADELCKLAQTPQNYPGTSVPRPVTPPSSAAAAAPTRRPSNAAPATADYLKAIPRQALTSPPGTSASTGWRPSPGYKPSATPAAKQPAPSPGAGGRRRRPGGATPWMSGTQIAERMINEGGAYNKRRNEQAQKSQSALSTLGRRALQNQTAMRYVPPSARSGRQMPTEPGPAKATYALPGGQISLSAKRTGARPRVGVNVGQAQIEQPRSRNWDVKIGPAQIENPLVARR